MKSMQRVIRPELKTDTGLVKDRTQTFKDGYMNGLMGMDDAFQSFIRQRVLQMGAENDGYNPSGPLPDGSRLKAVRDFLASQIFAQRPRGSKATQFTEHPSGSVRDITHHLIHDSKTSTPIHCIVFHEESHAYDPGSI